MNSLKEMRWRNEGHIEEGWRIEESENEPRVEVMTARLAH
jgi:hypothetical protein